MGTRYGGERRRMKASAKLLSDIGRQTTLPMGPLFQAFLEMNYTHNRPFTKMVIQYFRLGVKPSLLCALGRLCLFLLRQPIMPHTVLEVCGESVHSGLQYLVATQKLICKRSASLHILAVASNAYKLSCSTLMLVDMCELALSRCKLQIE